MIKTVKKYKFMFSELVKRDFKQKYKKTVLGMLWSILSPVLDFLVMKLVFTYFFGRDTPHYTTYLFSGVLINSYFHESTNTGMFSLVANSGIISKINVPKYMFLLSKNVSTLINFGLTMCIYFCFLALDDITFTWKFFTLLYPIVCLVIFNLGMGLILSALFVFFRDMQYLYGIFLKLLTYVSAIFYTLDRFPENVQRCFLLNPIYDYIYYFRFVIIDGQIPSLSVHLLCLGYAVAALLLGMIIYKVNNYKFVFYF